ncbi:UDP-N-acetylmuramate dehydrogenase [Magnetovibrio sp. PR-2]|uniref:UDP-N-acetylmuramate dehydrogenase n=1 Tax=Magnetovibrio sp. PR-2 TaxID=3120356 RepID=UPI002FCDE352
MAAATQTTNLINRLPKVRGRLSAGASLAKVTWFGVGGPAEVLFKPADAEDLADFLTNKSQDVPVTILGVGSNMLVRDGGIPGVVIRLGRGFVDVDVTNADVICGAGALDGNVAKAAMEAGVTGLEFLSGVPGTIGGALRMNAGAYGAEMQNIVVGAIALDAKGNRQRLDSADLGFSYRQSAVPKDWVFIQAHLRGHAGQVEDIRGRMDDIKQAREDSQPLRTSTGGSTFKNPDGHKAWELIDQAGCRGLRIGGAQVSEKHCNFLINHGNATAADIEDLGEEVRRRVKENSGIELDWEIKRIGVRPKVGPEGESQ